MRRSSAPDIFQWRYRVMTSKNGADFIHFVMPALAPASQNGQSRAYRSYRIIPNLREPIHESPRHRLVNHARNIGDQFGAVFLFGDAFGQHDDHVRFAPRSVDDGRVVVMFGDVTGFVGHARSGGQSGGDALVEALRHKYLDHLLAGATIQEFVLGDQPQEEHQVVSRRRVVLAGLKSFRVFDSAQHLDVLRAEFAHQFGDVFGLDLFDQQVCGQVAAPRDHPVDQSYDGHHLPDASVNLLVAVVVTVQPVFAAVDDAVELVFDLDRLVER